MTPEGRDCLVIAVLGEHDAIERTRLISVVLLESQLRRALEVPDPSQREEQERPS